MLGRAVQFNFDGPLPEPDYIIHRILERGTITVVSADSGAGKSLICASWSVCIMQGKPWLGYKTAGRRVMVVDEENFVRVVHGRFKALGMTNADRENLRYFLRLGVSLGAESWADRLLEEIADFQPDLLVIDTAAAATNVELNDNSGVARLFATSLRPLADSCAVTLLHHERKSSPGFRRNAGQAMMGARQWAGQADAHIAIEKLGDVYTEPLPDGGERRRFPLKMEMPKNRDGQGLSEKIVIVSEHDAGKTQPRWLRVERTR